MLTVTVRFYISVGGIAAGLILLWRLSWVLSRFVTRFESKVEADEKRFRVIETDVRDIRRQQTQARRIR
jgi:hypothetical protein